MSEKNDPMTMNITIHAELQSELDQQISHSDGQLNLKTAIARNLAIGLMVNNLIRNGKLRTMTMEEFAKLIPGA